MSKNLPQMYEQQQPTVIEYVPSVAVTLEQMASNLRELDKIMRRVMRHGVDYDTIPGTPKPTLLKPGAERLLQAFGLGHRMECVDQKEDWDNGFFYYKYKCTVVKTYPTHEIVVAECEGSANSKEKRYRNQDVYTIVNTLQKMAQKRALVGAALQATGTSGRFTQDVEDMEEDEPTAEKRQQKAPRKKLSPIGQKKMEILEKAKEKGLTEEQTKKLVRYHLRRDTNNMTMKEADELLDLINQMSGPELLGLIGEKTGEAEVIDIDPAEGNQGGQTDYDGGAVR